MRIVLDDVHISREEWSLSARGIFTEGTHLISGDIGSGKTTLSLMLAGLLKPSSGTIVREEMVSRMISFQFPEHHVTGSTLREECASWGIDPDTALASVNLTGKEDFPPLKLSRGELKRLHLACVMAKQYDLLILDEPFSSLDCREKERICNDLSLRTQGITIIFTHEQMQFPRVDFIWEITGGSLCSRGRLPDALPAWEHAPAVIKKLIRRGNLPENLTQKDLMEAACRT